MNDEIFEQTIWHIFESPVISSDQLIQIYNYIYLLCTKSDHEPGFKIQGREAYMKLKENINKYTASLQPFNSLNELCICLDNFFKSVNILFKCYHYLERFYIKTSIDKRDECIMDIKTLCYTYLHKNYLINYEKQILNMIIIESEKLTPKNSIELQSMKKTIFYIKEVLIANNEDKTFHNFLKQFVKHITTQLNIKDPPEDIADKLNNKIKISNALFDPFYAISIKRKFLKFLLRRKDEIVGLIIKNFESDMNLKFYYRCIEVFEEKEALSLNFKNYVNSKFKEMTKYKKEEQSGVIKKINKCKEILDAYIMMNEKIKSFFENDIIFVALVNQSIIDLNLQNFSNELIILLNKFLLNSETDTKIMYLIRLINLLKDIPNEETKLILDMQERLLFDRSKIEKEMIILESLDKKTHQSLHSTIVKLLKDIKQIDFEIRIGFNSADKVVVKERNDTEKEIVFEDDYEVSYWTNLNFKLLTFGFWKIEAEKNYKNNLLDSFKSTITDFLETKLLDKHIEFVYKMSPIFIELNGYEIKMSTLMYLVLYEIWNREKIKEVELQEHFDFEITRYVSVLYENEVILCEEEHFFVNKEFNKNLDLFDEKIADKNESYEESANSHSEIHRIEALIMKELKRYKEYDKNELLKNIECENKEIFNNAIKELIEKDYLVLIDDVLKYLP